MVEAPNPALLAMGLYVRTFPTLDTGSPQHVTLLATRDDEI
jgi:hypothetical protein